MPSPSSPVVVLDTLTPPKAPPPIAPTSSAPLRVADIFLSAKERKALQQQRQQQQQEPPPAPVEPAELEARALRGLRERVQQAREWDSDVRRDWKDRVRVGPRSGLCLIPLLSSVIASLVIKYANPIPPINQICLLILH